MNLWLSRTKEAISFESYDTYVIMTRKRDKKNGNKQVLGMSGIQTACATPESNHDVGGIIFTPGDVQGTRTAGHELGHIFGAEHDKPNCGKSYLMATFDGNPTDWSQCSINSFHESLKQQNWTCLYNKPNHTKFNNPGVYEIFESFEAEIENKDFFTVLMDDQKETFNLNEFTHSKEIVVYYIDEMLIIEQGGSDLAGEVIEPKELQYRIPDYRKLILNPKEIDP
ncbi:hypothetical protein G9C98_002885 [Cotesia typhae]|uniref:Peptidase M12B domain-containing protein n=1 Tax=Cotesia typhae TaxID=2053667 RepID=A0A8J5R4J4_9HYME|nr:hypothetical protein G9C98_002885 [Cotesia typhae]